MQEKDALQKVAGWLGFEVVHYDLNNIEDLESAGLKSAGGWGFFIANDVSATASGVRGDGARISLAQLGITFFDCR